MATNTFRPLALRAGVSTNVAAATLAATPATGSSTQNQQTVYEWLDNSSQWRTNPPFLKGSAGALHDDLVAPSGERPHILRGYIRRAEYSINDTASMSRLYFMYNPETISRDYLNYLDQGALDPFNTVFQSGNLVAPPSMLNFSFELFFDRQEEATARGHRGVLVDMDFFDLVVRNVKPGGTTGTNNALPDNGVMMVNPRDITVVFSPEITVQGRPLNASVTYERFTYKMVPTRMRINLQIRVVYFGPQRETTTFAPETVRALEAVTFLPDPKAYEFRYKALTFEGNNEAYGVADPNDPSDGESDPNATTNVDIDEELSNQSIPAGSESGYMRLNMEAMSNGYKRAHETQREFDGNTTTQYGGDERRTPLWNYVDCSSFVWGCYGELGLSESLGWEKWDGEPSPSRPIDEATLLYRSASSNVWPESTHGMIDKFTTNSSPCRVLYSGGGESLTVAKVAELGHSGDLILRKETSSRSGHVAFVWTINGGSVKIMHAGSSSIDVAVQNYNGGNYGYLIRPFPKV